MDSGFWRWRKWSTDSSQEINSFLDQFWHWRKWEYFRKDYFLFTLSEFIFQRVNFWRISGKICRIFLSQCRLSVKFLQHKFYRVLFANLFFRLPNLWLCFGRSSCIRDLRFWHYLPFVRIIDFHNWRNNPVSSLRNFKPERNKFS